MANERFSSVEDNQEGEYIPLHEKRAGKYCSSSSLELQPYARRDQFNLQRTVCVALCFTALILGIVILQEWKLAEPLPQHGSLKRKRGQSAAISSEPYRPKSKELTDFDLQTRDSSPWNESALRSLRPAFHFMSTDNWMNDPDAPLFYQGWYHLFYQYNPSEPFWGLISWGHAVSRDLIHWLYLDLAMVPDQWYDINGVWTGSATILQNGTPAIIYTGSSNTSVQTQSVVFPEDPSDPLLRNWSKVAQNPVLSPPTGINYTDFRDPTTAWLGSDGLWTLTIGSQVEEAGMALLYRSSDFINWEQQEGVLHRVNGTGMWECVDFYPVLESGEKRGLDTSEVGDGVMHVLKASMDDSRVDFYVLGSYNPENFTFTPIDSALDLTSGFRYDSGRYYASKTFFDPVKQRRILFGWTNESDTLQDDLSKGWAGVQAIPREVWFDNYTQKSLIQWPIDEILSLRFNNITIKDISLESGSVMEVEGAQGVQWDIALSFINPTVDEYIDQENTFSIYKNDLSTFQCNASGASHNGMFGPFGVLVLSTSDLEEQTAIYFYLSASLTTFSMGGKEKITWRALVCNDLTRSSLASNLDNGVHGGPFIVLEDEKNLFLRVIVDRSIIETFAQGGRMTSTSRVYPTRALEDFARVFIFNNGTMPITLNSFEAWKISSINIHDF